MNIKFTRSERKLIQRMYQKFSNSQERNEPSSKKYKEHSDSMQSGKVPFIANPRNRFGIFSDYFCPIRT